MNDNEVSAIHIFGVLVSEKKVDFDGLESVIRLPLVQKGYLNLLVGMTNTNYFRYMLFFSNDIDLNNFFH